MNHASGFVANPSESLCHCVTSPFGKGGLIIILRRTNYGALPFLLPKLFTSPCLQGEGDRLRWRGVAAKRLKDIAGNDQSDFSESPSALRAPPP